MNDKNYTITYKLLTNEELNNTDKITLILLLDNSEIGTRELSFLIQRSSKQVRRVLQKLQELGYIKLEYPNAFKRVITLKEKAKLYKA